MSDKITIIDYGMGNLYSVCNAIAAVGGAPIVTSDKEVIAARGRRFWGLYGQPSQKWSHSCDYGFFK